MNKRTLTHVLLGLSAFTIIATIIAYFVISLPAGYIFGFVLEWGTVGIWMGFPVGLTTAGIAFYLRFRRKTRLTHVHQL